MRKLSHRFSEGEAMTVSSSEMRIYTLYFKGLPYFPLRGIGIYTQST
jgi:hypothetical protein